MKRAFIHTAAPRLFGLIVCLVTMSAGLATAAEPGGAWPQFLGPHRDGQVPAHGPLNLDWKAKKPKLLWKMAHDGGFSSCSFAGDKLFTQVKRGDRDIAICLDAATGEEIWAHDGAPSFIDRQRQGAGPRATPTYTPDGRVYCLFARGELYCLDARTGKEIWKNNILEATKAGQHGDLTYYWGMSGSPLIEGDLVITLPGGSKDNAVAAFHKDTGKLAWSVGSDSPGYASPIVIEAAGVRQLVCLGGNCCYSLDPVKGSTLWEYKWGNKYNCNCATPLWVDETLFLSSAYGTGAVALKIEKQGDKLAVRELWKNKNLLNQFTTSMIVDGHVYGSHGDFSALALRCLDLKTGEVKWIERKPGKCGLIAVDGHLIVLNEKGSLMLVKADPKEFVLKGELPGLLTYRSWALPAVYQQRLYVRDQKQLLCLDLSK
ncbi:MAG: PQQ-binding-like beta-propeller repeat protein [Gemmataceae bacterium]